MRSDKKVMKRQENLARWMVKCSFSRVEIRNVHLNVIEWECYEGENV